MRLCPGDSVRNHGNQPDARNHATDGAVHSASIRRIPHDKRPAESDDGGEAQPRNDGCGYAAADRMKDCGESDPCRHFWYRMTPVKLVILLLPRL
jgi:hypothetical protein